MALPINIEDLLNKRKVESNRIEFKAGWNPDKIYHTICAFATDLENMGGGYVLVGVEEENGIAKRPVKGLSENEIDRIMKEMVGYDAKLSPSYLTKVSPEEVDGKTILAIWAPVGVNRPYSVMESVVAKNSVPKFYVRSKSSTIEAKGEVLDEVRNLANRIPFDERGNATATIDDISGVLVYEYLKAVKSKLVDGFSQRPLEDTLDAMDLVVGPVENRQIKNAALMMFCEHPERFFPQTKVRMAVFTEGLIENPDEFIEIPEITGPVPKLIRETLSYLRTNVIKQMIAKPSDKPESIKTFNYPYQAFEEAVVNALYHRDYQERQPVEIRVEPTHVEILSFSGPDRSISERAIREGKKLIARRYRNRMLGTFLKELGLTEGWATGIPTIQKVLRENGSKPAVIDTDENRSYFLITIPCREGFNSILEKEAIRDESYFSEDLRQILGQAFVKVQSVINQCVIRDKEQLIQILEQTFVKVWRKSKSKTDISRLAIAVVDLICILEQGSLSITELKNSLGFEETYEIRRQVIIPMMELGIVEMTLPDKPTSSKQRYKLSLKGKSLFN